MKITVTGGSAILPSTEYRSKPIGLNGLFLEFKDTGMARVNVRNFLPECDVAELELSVRTFAQAVQYGVERKEFGRDINQYERDHIQGELRAILECRDPRKEFFLILPTDAEVVIKLTEKGLVAASQHAENRAAYFCLLPVPVKPTATGADSRSGSPPPDPR
ncbi:MAG: hypothetical protein QOJ84_3770 [Bradyrhizobium sp.]|jgi:hypothetical protein|nr:hypothetical protein [Bradyrhizobium sp.]